jgi:predicted O-methyltransferase YrrM
MNLRESLGPWRRDLCWVWGLRGLPAQLVWFQWRARRLATRTGDWFSLQSATRPADLRILLQLAKGCRHVVELGTATGWTALSLALEDAGRRVVTYDPFARRTERHLELVAPEVSARIEWIAAPGATGPRSAETVDLLYIDSSHERAPTIAEVSAWRPYLRPGALVVFDDFDHPDFSGVHAAIDELELAGEQLGTLYVHGNAGV